MHKGNGVVIVAGPAIMALLCTAASAALVPVSTIVHAQAAAQVGSNASRPADEMDDSGTTGDFSASAHDSDTFSPSGGSLASDSTADASAHVAADGASGTANLTATWIASSSLSPGSDNHGSFAIETSFQYSFFLDAPASLSIDITTACNDPVINDLMNINHVVTVDGAYTDLPLNGTTPLDIDLLAGFHQFTVEHDPNAGLSPWVTAARTATTDVIFAIDVPEPGGMLSIVVVGPLLARRRRQRA